MSDSANSREDARARILAAFERLRVFQRHEQRAVHKPLLVLFNLGRVARNEPRLIEFAQLEGPFKQLLTEFGPSSAPASRHYPFWHLATDSNGAIWQVKGPQEILARPPSATPNLGELKSGHVMGGFAPSLDAELRSDPVLIREIAQRILDAHFPLSLHPDLLAAVGLDIDIGTVTAVPQQRRRDPGFRERVLRAYEYRCCVCAFDLRIGSVTAALEAAHIQWFQANGPDIESNGLALCALHHKIFDLGVYTVLAESFTVVFSQHAAMSEGTRKNLLAYHGAGIILPQSRDYFPSQVFLAWHQKEVFKKPARDA